MAWIIAYESPRPSPMRREHWLEESHPSREDALSACDMILRNGGVVASVTERLNDGSIACRLGHRDILRALDIRDE
jgi:hypothetical protein